MARTRGQAAAASASKSRENIYFFVPNLIGGCECPCELNEASGAQTLLIFNALLRSSQLRSGAGFRKEQMLDCTSVAFLPYLFIC